MNSFNHWGFGSVGEWVWRELAGINPDEEHRAISTSRSGRALWRPRLGQGPVRLDPRAHCRASGNNADGRLPLHVEIPANTTATVGGAGERSGGVTESGKPATEAAV